MSEAIEKIKKYCAYQDRAENEVRQKLRSLEVNSSEIEKIVSELKAEKYLDEERFVESFIRGKINAKKWGTEKIKAHLIAKGISSSLIERYMADIDQGKYQQNLYDNINKWLRTNLLTTETYSKLCRHLLSKGYTYQEIKNAIQKSTNY